MTLARDAAFLIVMISWAAHLAYPLNLLQSARWTLFGFAVPIYYFFTAGLMAAAAALALFSKRRWGRWELLWCALPLVCLPGLARSADRVWSAREWLSWIIRGVIPGGVIFLTARRALLKPLLLYAIFPVVIAASALGLREVYSHKNPYWDRYYYSFAGAVAGTAQPDNPFYRPNPNAFNSYIIPLGTQGSRVPYAATLVGFLPLGLWLLKHKRRFFALPALAAGVLASILLLAQVRSTWLAAAVAVLVLPALGFRPRRREGLAVGGSAALLLALFLALPQTRGPLLERFHSFHRSETSIRERLEVLRTISLVKKHWLAGVGYGQFPTAGKVDYPPNLVWNGTPDDQALRWAQENGVPGFLLLIAFFVGLVRAGWRRVERMDEQEADFYRALLAGWLGVCVTFLFFDGFYWGACNMTFWSLLGLYATSLYPEGNSPAPK